uniref:SFRICE_000401 n=1 Tax=Spodoptera frugiperda TaxID=7108 RepID=A0A2H1WF05_SPOFR
MASPGRPHHERSMETILTFDNRDLQSQWSVVWSTTHITDVDNVTNRSTQNRLLGRRRLRLGSLALSAMMTMHCRIPASSLTDGLFLSIVFFTGAVLGLANPLRHFEVYLGQWSISGPGRAFRIIPMLDGIGIAMCINAIVRAISCCTMAAIAAVYVMHSVADSKLPFTYCRDFNFNTYDPQIKNLKIYAYRTSKSKITPGDTFNETSSDGPKSLRNATYFRSKYEFETKIGVCNETYIGRYPGVYSTPAYNFFYVEVVQYRTVNRLGRFNVRLAVIIIFAWLTLWLIMIMEKFNYSRLVWNNIKPWFLIVPTVWTIIFVVYAAANLSWTKAFRRSVKLGSNEIIAALADALEVSLYTHSLGVGTELIHGKALNHFANGHIDPDLNNENVWHSVIVLMLMGLHSGGAAMCAFIDYMQLNSTTTYTMREGTTWIIPMYSKCTSLGNYSHLVTTLVFGGLTFSYLTVTFMLLKTALHTIFEYRVKLVFKEQLVVAALILSCMLLSMIFATNGGIAFLDSVDAIMTGIGTPFVVLLELIGLLYVYRSHDFQSDMNVATEDNACSSRLGIQWQIVPFVTLITIGIKLSRISRAEMPTQYMCLAAVPMVFLILAIPLRAAHNAFAFLHHPPQAS